MIRAHRNLGIDATLGSAAILLGHNGSGDGDQIRIAIEMFSLVERAVRFVSCVAQMDEMDVLNDSIAKRNSSYTDLIKNSLTKQLFIDPRVYFAHAGIWNGKKCPIVDDKLSMGQKAALHLMWMIKQAEFNLARAVKNFSTSKDRRLAAQRAQRVIIFDGLFSNLSDEKLINDAFEGLKYVGGNFQLIGLMHNPRYVNNPDIFPTYLVGERFRKSDDPIDRGFIAIDFKRNNGKIKAKESHA
jgi:glycosyltransferase involved in cell wall biosynthesis